MDPKQRAALAKVTTGLLAGEAENPAREVAKITDDKTTEIDVMTTEVSIEHLENFAKQDKPFLMSINFGKKHQPNKPAKAFKGASSEKSQYSDSVVELDHHIGQITYQVRKLGIGENTLVFYTVYNSAWQDVHSDAVYTPFRGAKGTVRAAASRIPAIAYLMKTYHDDPPQNFKANNTPAR